MRRSGYSPSKGRERLCELLRRGAANSFLGPAGASFAPAPAPGCLTFRGSGWEGAPPDVFSRRGLTLAALMDSVISPGPLSADGQSGRRWQVKNTLLAKRLRWGPCHENYSDEKLLGQEISNGTKGAEPSASLLPPT